MNKELITASVYELSEGNEIYMTIILTLATSRRNKNGAKFTKEFLQEVVNNKDYYLAIPLVADRRKLSLKRYSSLGHNKNANNDLLTDSIGAYVDFFTNDTVDGELELFGVVRVYKRYADVCKAIQELYDSGRLFFSVEVLVAEYTNMTDTTRDIDAGKGNLLIGNCIVSTPADVESTAHILIAEKENGGEEMEDEKILVAENVVEEVAEAIDNSETAGCGGGKEKMEEATEDAGCGTKDNMEDAGCGGGNKEKMEEATEDAGCGGKEKMEESQTENAEIEIIVDVEPEPVICPDGSCLCPTCGQTMAMPMESASTEISEVSKIQEQLTILSESVIKKDAEIAELKVFKQKLDEINAEIFAKEVAEKKESLKIKYSKLLSEDVIASTEIAEAIEKLDESILSAKVVEVALSKVETAETDKKEVKEVKKVMLTASRYDNSTITTNDVVSRYITIAN